MPKNVETKIVLLCSGAVSAAFPALEAKKSELLCVGAVSAVYHAQEIEVIAMPCVAVCAPVPAPGAAIYNEQHLTAVCASMLGPRFIQFLEQMSTIFDAEHCPNVGAHAKLGSRVSFDLVELLMGSCFDLHSPRQLAASFISSRQKTLKYRNTLSAEERKKLLNELDKVDMLSPGARAQHEQMLKARARAKCNAIQARRERAAAARLGMRAEEWAALSAEEREKLLAQLNEVDQISPRSRARREAEVSARARALMRAKRAERRAQLSRAKPRQVGRTMGDGRTTGDISSTQLNDVDVQATDIHDSPHGSRRSRSRANFPLKATHTRTRDPRISTY
eukprot:g1450.t1